MFSSRVKPETQSLEGQGAPVEHFWIRCGVEGIGSWNVIYGMLSIDVRD